MDKEPIQCIFDFNTGNLDGYANFQREQQAKNAKITEIWTVPVGRTVRLTLHGVLGSFEGKLMVAEQPKIFNKSEPLYLKIGRSGFYHNEIKICNIIE